MYRGRGNRRGGFGQYNRNQNNRYREDDVWSNISNPVPVVDAVEPITTKTTEKEDPHSENIVIESFSGLSNVYRTRHFQIDYSQFLTLIESSYQAQVRQDQTTKISKYISLNMYNYYCTIALWKRLYSVIGENGASYELDSLIRSLPEMPIPQDIVLYLRGIGNLTDSQGRQFWLELQQQPHKELVEGQAGGGFGPVDEISHIWYETIPAPVISLIAIKQDVNYTKNPTMKRDWDLPSTICSNEEGCGLPTKNFLGWRPAQKLTSEQMDAIEDAGMVTDKDKIDYNVKNVANIPINYTLLCHVGGHLTAKCCLDTEVEKSFNGSFSQELYTTRVGSDQDFDRYRRASEKAGTTRSAMQRPHSISCAASMFRYRFKRNGGNCTDCYAYDWTSGTLVPELWIANENSVFEAGESSLWTSNDFTTGEQNSLRLLEMLSRKFR